MSQQATQSLAEQIVIGAALLGAEWADVVSEVVSLSDFGDRRHGEIWTAIRVLRGRGEPCDPEPVLSQLGERISHVGGGPYLLECMQAVPAVVQAGYYARRVAENARERRETERAERHRAILRNPNADVRRAELAALAAEILEDVPGETAAAADARGRRLVLTAAADIEPEPVIWAWEEPDTLGLAPNAGRIPLGSLSVAAGREGTGKSSFGIWMAAHITRGTLSGSLAGKPRAVIYAAVEDSWKYTLVPRLIAAGADLSKVFRVEVVEDEQDGVTISLPSDNVLLERELRRIGAALLVLDPLMSTIGAGIDTHRERDVRIALDPLARLADRAGAVVLGIAHFNKGASTDASSLITGSGAFKNVPRSVFGFAVDSDGGRVMSQSKNSLGRLDLPSLSYQIEGVDIPTRSGPAHVGRLVWLGESDRSVSEILGDRGDVEERAERDEAADWLRSYLADQGGEAAFTDLIKCAKAEGLSERTLRRARTRAGVETERIGFPSKTIWRLQLGQLGHSGHSPATPATLSNPVRTGRTVAGVAGVAAEPTPEGSAKSAPSPASAPLLPSLPSLPSGGQR